MKTESTQLSANGLEAILWTAGMASILIFFSMITGCVKEIGRQNTHDRDTAALLAAVRMQMGVVEGSEHLAR